MQRKALGKGLKALIPVVEEKREGILLEIVQIDTSPEKCLMMQDSMNW